MKTGPKFPTRMYSASALRRVLIGGEENPKIGKTWEKGRGWKGSRIFTLTLPERATCSMSCKVWNECMGDNMPSSIRVLPDEHLIPKLAAEIPVLLAKCDRIAVRTHVLGDYYSAEYARFWIDQVRKYDGRLRLFGFTANPRDSEIGSLIEAESAANWDRFAIRFSGSDGARSATVMIDPPRGTLRDGSTVCPEQTGDAPDCARCGLCLHINKKRIVFKLHD